MHHMEALVKITTKAVRLSLALGLQQLFAFSSFSLVFRAWRYGIVRSVWTLWLCVLCSSRVDDARRLQHGGV